jgi:hypothetical protein
MKSRERENLESTIKVRLRQDSKSRSSDEEEVALRQFKPEPQRPLFEDSETDQSI